MSEELPPSEADGHEPGPGWVTELQVPVEKA